MTYVLTINGVEQNLSEANLSLHSLSASWTRPREFAFAENVPHHEAAFSVEDYVLLSVDGAIRFRGRIKRIDLDGAPGAERIIYRCLGLRELSKDVAVCDPDHGFPRVVFNAPPDDDDYDENRSAKTVGEIIQWLFDNHAGELRAAGVIAAAPATGYVPAELDALAVVPPKVVLDSQHFDAALTELMAFQPAHRFAADPDTQTYRFLAVAELPEKTVTYNSPDKPLSALLKPSTRDRATALQIFGPMRPVNQTLYLSDGGLTKLWTTGLETDWTWAKCFDPENGETYGRVYRRFQVTDTARRMMAHTLAEPASLGTNAPALCPQVYRKTDTGAWAWVPASFDFPNGIILLAQPATVGDEYIEGDAECTADLCLVYAWLDEPLSARSPAEGYEGTAYTQPGNPVEVVRRVYDEQFTLPSQTEQYEDLARELLQATKDVIYEGTVRLAKLDWSLASLACRLNFAAHDDDGNPITTGFESLGAVLLAVHYDLAHARTDLVLSSDTSHLSDWSDRSDLSALERTRELETQARRNQQHRALDGSLHAPVPRAGNDGEFGAAENARGVYSLRRSEDDEAQRVAGHVDLEAGPGITITRQASAGHNGFALSANKRGEWHWFHYTLSNYDADKTYDMHASDKYTTLSWYPVLAGRVTRVIVYTPQQLSAGTVTVKPSRKTKGEAVCPEVRTDPDYPAAVITASTNIAHGDDDPGVSFIDDDVLGLRVITSAGYVIGGYFIDVIAGAYFEED